MVVNRKSCHRGWLIVRVTTADRSATADYSVEVCDRHALINTNFDVFVTFLNTIDVSEGNIVETTE